MFNNYIFIIFLKIRKFFKKNIQRSEGHFNNQNILITYICTKLLMLPKKHF